MDSGKAIYSEVNSLDIIAVHYVEMIKSLYSTIGVAFLGE